MRSFLNSLTISKNLPFHYFCGQFGLLTCISIKVAAAVIINGQIRPFTFNFFTKILAQLFETYGQYGS